MKNLFLKKLLLAISILLTLSVFSQPYYVAAPTGAVGGGVNGNDANPGTITAPFATLEKLTAVLNSRSDLGANVYCYVRGGTFYPTGSGNYVNVSLNGAAGIVGIRRIWAYPDEKPVFDCRNRVTAGTPQGMVVIANNLHIKGLTIKNVRQGTGGGFAFGLRLLNSNLTIIDQFEIYNIGGSGMVTQSSFNCTIKNCDVHHCGDGEATASSPFNGGDCFNDTGGDGSSNNTYDGCRGYLTGDDIWDFFGWRGTNQIWKNCWAAWASVRPWGTTGSGPIKVINGVATEAPPYNYSDPAGINQNGGWYMTPANSDVFIQNKNGLRSFNALKWGSHSGEGFKLGGNTLLYGGQCCNLWTTTTKKLYNCFAFENSGSGFAANMQYNEGAARHEFYNCGSFQNQDGGWGYGTGRRTGIADYMKNCFAYQNGASKYPGYTGGGDWVYDGLPTNISNNYWDGSYYSASAGYGNLKPSVISQLSSADFSSVNSTIVAGSGTYSQSVMDAPRQADGSLPIVAYGHLSAASKLLDKGVNVGLTYCGTAPDLGPFEFCNSGPSINIGTNVSIVLPTNSVTFTPSISGTFSAYQWTQLSGGTATISSPNTANTSITNLTEGVYTFSLTGTTSGGADISDTVTVTVNPALPNQAPTANAGLDKNITLPNNTVSLTGSGTDPDGTISAYLWRKLTGPANGTITNPASAAASVTGLVLGIYTFELRVTDNNGAADTDTMRVTVNAAVNQAPAANAGTDQIITLPTNTVSLNGSGTDPDGTITAYLWRKITGPASGTITNTASATTSVTGLVQGIYTFELKVTDNSGATDTDTMKVTVNPVPNQAPTANAGGDQMITLPTNSVSLNGSGTDPNGTITSYSWRKITGPANGTITNLASAATTVTGLIQGVYSFELKVTDNNGATDTDTMKVTVNPAPNQAPTANAGTDQIITLPTNSVSLNGSGTDPNGTITAYSWRKITGPASGTISNPASATTSVTGLVQGIYTFELRVTDNNGAADTDTMKVTVNPEVIPGNLPPTADAGADISIYLPEDSVQLTGSGTDPDGTIVSYNWRWVSGGAFVLLNSTNATADLSYLQQGIYEFELTVTDNNGATGKDTIQITVGSARLRASEVDGLVILGNPVIDQVNAKISSYYLNRQVILTLFDIRGALLLRKELMLTQHTTYESINLSKFQKGLYFLKLNFDPRNAIVEKIIKQ